MANEGIASNKKLVNSYTTSIRTEAEALLTDSASAIEDAVSIITVNDRSTGTYDLAGVVTSAIVASVKNDADRFDAVAQSIEDKDEEVSNQFKLTE